MPSAEAIEVNSEQLAEYAAVAQACLMLIVSAQHGVMASAWRLPQQIVQAKGAIIADGPLTVH